jgi:hypothetical protein
MRRAGRALLSVAASSLIALALGPAGMAMAQPPTVTITSPTNGSATNNQMPSFAGTTDQFERPRFDRVTLNIYAGSTVGGALVQTITTQELLGDTWSLGPSEILPDGVYVAQATQTNFQMETGASAPVTFRVDTTSPSITLTYPANGSSTSGSQLVAGTAGTAEGDLSTITIELVPGSTTESGAPLESLTVQASNGSWSAEFGGLSPGTYTVRAEQSDNAGNTGKSQPVTFTVAPLPPVASFIWFPSTPTTGQSVSLVSTSTDTTSPIVALAWALAGSGVFQVGNSILTTSFSTPGAHSVRLRVTSADGLSSVATETIPVTSPAPILMQPFPIVRIVGSDTPSGVFLDLLAVRAPVGARVTVTCRGPGCPARSVTQLAASSTKTRAARTVALTFRRFERSLQAGVTLEARVSKPGEIGKYTSFKIRRGKLPARTDACLWPSNPKPIACPS